MVRRGRRIGLAAGYGDRASSGASSRRVAVVAGVVPAAARRDVPDRLRQRVQPAVALRGGGPVPAGAPRVGASAWSSGARRSGPIDRAEPRGAGVDAGGGARPARSSPAPTSSRSCSSGAAALLTFVAAAAGPVRAGRRRRRVTTRRPATRSTAASLAQRPRAPERAGRDRRAHHRAGRDGPDHDDDAAAHDRARPRPRGGRPGHQRPHVRDVRAVADLRAADRSIRERAGHPGRPRHRRPARRSSRRSPRPTAACSCSSRCSCSATAGTSATSPGSALLTTDLSLAERTRVQGLTDGLIWSSAAAASLGSGRGRGAARRLRDARAARRGAGRRARCCCARWPGARRVRRVGRAGAALGPRPSSRSTHAARTRAQVSTSSSGTYSSALWATRTSPGPKITHGVSPWLTNICMSAPYGSPSSAGRRPVTASATSASPTGQRVVGRDARRPEPAAGDLDRRRVLAQEVVARRRPRRSPRAARLRRRPASGRAGRRSGRRRRPGRGPSTPTRRPRRCR